MANDTVPHENRSGLVVSLNRADKLNSLNVEMFEALERHLEILESETNSIGCIVLRGAGRCSAGHDLAALQAGEILPRPSFQAPY